MLAVVYVAVARPPTFQASTEENMNGTMVMMVIMLLFSLPN
jgi:hypothetical protein